MPENASQLLSAATPVTLGANRPLWLNDANKAWVVQSGHIHVFLVPVADEKPTGPRHHLFRVGEGEILMGIDPAQCGQELILMGTGSSESVLLELTSAQLLTPDATDHQQAAAWLDGWIGHWYQALGVARAPKSAVIIKAGEETPVSAGVTIRPWDGVLWVRQIEGRSRLAGLDRAEFTSDQGWIPFRDPAWLEGVEPGTIVATDTAGRLRDGLSGTGLESFYQIVAIWLQRRLTASAHAETGRLQARSQSQQRTLAGAVNHLAALLGASGTDKTFPTQSRDPLLAAAQTVGEALGLQIKPPPKSEGAAEIRDQLSRVAAASHVRVRRVVLSAEWWEKDSGPLLAYLEADGQPVALIPTKNRGYVLVDSVQQTRVPFTEKTAQLLKPVAYTFHRSFPERALTVKDVLLFGLRGTMPDLWTIVLMGTCAGLLSLLTPIGTGMIFDTIIPGSERQQLLQLTLALLGAAVGIVLFDLTRTVALLRLETRSDVSIQGAVWDRLLGLPVPFFRNYTTGDLTERANGINAIRQILSSAVMNSLLSAVFSLFSFALLFYYSFELALVATLLVGVNVAVTLAASALNLRLQRPLYDLWGKLSGLVLQLVTGIAKLRVAGAERHGYAIWAKTFAAYKRFHLKGSMLFGAFDVFHAVFPILTSIVLFGAMAFSMSHHLSTGQFLAFNAAFGAFLAGMLQLGSSLVSVLDVVPLFERAKPILQTLPEVDQARTDPGELTGRIEVSHVSFCYEKDSPPILHDINLQVAPGEFIAIVGPSGSGKSTLLRLLLGFEVPTSGTIHVDGHDLANLDLRAVRRQFGVVLQQAKIFPGTILENIVGSSLLGIDQAWEAAERAGLKDDITAMPMGMHTFLSEGAGTLSGGQRQRLIIARAIVSRPHIVLFDEATSALDNRTQAIVSRSLDGLQSTRIVIAHRLSTIMNADRIFVLQAGRLVQKGTYQELLHAPGPFAELAKRQLA